MSPLLQELLEKKRQRQQKQLLLARAGKRESRSERRRRQKEKDQDQGTHEVTEVPDSSESSASKRGAKKRGMRRGKILDGEAKGGTPPTGNSAQPKRQRRPGRGGQAASGQSPKKRPANNKDGQVWLAIQKDLQKHLEPAVRNDAAEPTYQNFME